MSPRGVHLGLPLSPAAPSAPRRSSMWTLFWPRGRQVRTALKNSDFSLFTSLTCTNLLLSYLPLFELPRCAGAWAGGVQRWWCGGSWCPRARLGGPCCQAASAAPGGAAAAQRASGGCQHTCWQPRPRSGGPRSRRWWSCGMSRVGVGGWCSGPPPPAHSAPVGPHGRFCAPEPTCSKCKELS
jgi:hypothetical protein